MKPFRKLESRNIFYKNIQKPFTKNSPALSRKIRDERNLEKKRWLLTTSNGLIFFFSFLFPVGVRSMVRLPTCNKRGNKSVFLDFR